jgi:Ino eighty subunit 1
MKTALRSYHPVPSLQKTDGNVQDAPRIKNCLKAAFLPGEQKSAPPSTPADILARAKAGHIPPTSVVNLIFVLVNYSSSLMPIHFEPDVEFVDLFLPINISSAARARAFLWMIFHYHEGPNLANPFADDHARRNPGKVPWLLRLSREEQAQENVDPPEELEWGRKMAQTRSRFLQELVAGGELDKATRTLSGSSSHDAEPSSVRRSRTQQYYPSDGNRTTFHHYVPTDGGKVKPTQSVLPAVHTGMRTREHWLEHRDNYSLLHQVWHRVQNTDPLADSDDEGLDEHARLDYQRRLHVLDLIRLQPTPHFAPSG